MQLMNFAFGADVVLANSGYGTTMLFNNSVVLPNSKIFAAIISIIFAIGLVIYMKKSKLGRAIRATAQNARAAKILGVDTEKGICCNFWHKCSSLWCCWSINFNNIYNSSLYGATIHN